MRKTRLIMNMPVIVEITDRINPEIFNELFDYFRYIDNTFSTFKKTSEITGINEGVLKPGSYSADMQEVLRLAQKTKIQTAGYFDITYGGKIDPSGIVKGWAIHNAAKMLSHMGIKNYYVEAGGDIEVAGVNKEGNPWTIGIRNPFNVREIVKVVRLHNRGIATSGTYERGKHIYNPIRKNQADEIASITVIGPNVLEADRFATAAFAMGKKGITFIGSLRGLDGYMIDKTGKAIFTEGFEKYSV